MVTYYIVKRCTSSGLEAKKCGSNETQKCKCGSNETKKCDLNETKKCGSNETKKCDLNGSVKTRNGSLVTPRPATLSMSKARNEFECDVIDGPPSDLGMSSSNAEDAGGDCGSQCPQSTPRSAETPQLTPRSAGISFRRRNRSDSVASGSSSRRLNRSDSVSGTTTLILTDRDPSQLLLYGLESLKRSIRLWEETRNRLMGNDASGKT